MASSGPPDIDALREGGDVRGLIEALADEDGYVQLAAASALGELGDARAVEPLVGVLQLGGATGAVTRALAELGEPAVEPLIAVAADDEEGDERRANAIVALRRIGDPRAAEALIVALRSGSDSVCGLAADALRGFADPRAVEPLIGVLRGPYARARSDAVNALAAIGEPAVEPLAAVLRDREESESARVEAAEALGRIGGRRAADALSAVADDESDVVRAAVYRGEGGVGGW
jgi:HEAT repeat protein